mgnify:FL=1
MEKRRTAIIGIKQTIRLEWMEKTANLLLAGLPAEKVRQELTRYLANRRGSGLELPRSEHDCKLAVAILMNCWVNPLPEFPEIEDLRKLGLLLLREELEDHIAIHFGILCAVYPYWFNIALQTGRLFNLQDAVAASQIVTRLKEIYGDRQTIMRTSRYVLRSFIAWDLICDSRRKGNYIKGDPIFINDVRNAGFLMLSAFYAMGTMQADFNALFHSPAFFTFKIPSIAPETLHQLSENIEIVQIGANVLVMKK